MSKDVKTIPGRFYTITQSGAGTVHARLASGTLLLLASTGSAGQVFVQAVSDYFVVSDDAAVVRSVKTSVPAGEDGMSADAVEEVVESVLLKASTEIKTPEGTEDWVYYSADIPAKYVPAGKLRSIVLQGGNANTNAFGQPAFLSVWQEQAPGTDNFQPVAVSMNSVKLEANQAHEWFFNNPTLLNERIRFCFLATDANGAEFREEFNIRTRVSSTSKWQDGHLFDPYTQHKLPELTIKLVGQGERFAPKSHEGDTVAHLSADEHEGLTAILAHKDELLALFPDTSTTEYIEEDEPSEPTPMRDCLARASSENS